MNTETPKRTIDIINHKIDCADLLGDKKELMIQHKKELYRLQITGNDKLILTK